jgi:hypothetical protein
VLCTSNALPLSYPGTSSPTSRHHDTGGRGSGGLLARPAPTRLVTPHADRAPAWGLSGDGLAVRLVRLSGCALARHGCLSTTTTALRSLSRGHYHGGRLEALTRSQDDSYASRRRLATTARCARARRLSSWHRLFSFFVSERAFLVHGLPPEAALNRVCPHADARPSRCSARTARGRER